MFRQLTFRDRIYIEVLRWGGLPRKEIARRLNVHVSTIRRELYRGRTSEIEDGYRADLGERHARLEKGPQVSNETIYAYLKRDKKEGGRQETGRQGRAGGRKNGLDLRKKG